MTRASCRRRTGKAPLRAEKFGDLKPADHKVLNEEGESRNSHRYAVVVQDLAAQWIQAHPCKTKTSQEKARSLSKFLEPSQKKQKLLIRTIHVDLTRLNCFRQTRFASAIGHESVDPKRRTRSFMEEGFMWTAVGHISILLSILRKSECFKHALVISVFNLMQVLGRYCASAPTSFFLSYHTVVVCLLCALSAPRDWLIRPLFFLGSRTKQRASIHHISSTIHWNLAHPVKICHGIIEFRHLIDPGRMALLKEQLRIVKEGTSSVLLQSGLDDNWWAASMEC